MIPLRFPPLNRIPLIPAVPRFHWGQALAGMRGKNPKSVVFGFFHYAATAILAAKKAFLNSFFRTSSSP